MRNPDVDYRYLALNDMHQHLTAQKTTRNQQTIGLPVEDVVLLALVQLYLTDTHADIQSLSLKV
jgi:hypothetical protein